MLKIIILIVLLAPVSLACELTPELLELTKASAEAQGIDPNLLGALFWAESRYCHRGESGITTSPAGALGLGQLMPATAQGLGVDPHNRAQNAHGAAKYLRQQYDVFGDWRLALAAYNAGPGAVTKWGGIPPYDETLTYVETVMKDWRSRISVIAATPAQSALVPVVTPTVAPSALVFRKELRAGSALVSNR